MLKISQWFLAFILSLAKALVNVQYKLDDGERFKRGFYQMHQKVFITTS